MHTSTCIDFLGDIVRSYIARDARNTQQKRVTQSKSWADMVMVYSNQTRQGDFKSFTFLLALEEGVNLLPFVYISIICRKKLVPTTSDHSNQSDVRLTYEMILVDIRTIKILLS